MILPDRAYAFFSHTHKAQKENMPLLDKVLFYFRMFSSSASIFNTWFSSLSIYQSLCGMQILAERVSLYDYELIVGDHANRLLAFGKYAGRAGFIDFLLGLGQSMFQFTQYLRCFKFICYGNF